LNVRHLTMLCLSLAALWMMLLGPATESSTYLILAPTLAWIVVDAWHTPSFRFEFVVLGASLLCFCLAHMSVWFPTEVRRGAIVLQPTGALLLSGVALYRAYREIADARLNASVLAEEPRRLAA
jgi:hypothetical protein